MLQYMSIEELCRRAEEEGVSLSEAVLADQSAQTEVPREEAS